MGDDGLIAEAAKSLKLENGDGDAMTYVSHCALDPSRRQLYAEVWPECGGEAKVVAIVARCGSETREFVAVVEEGPTLSLIMGSCQIMMEDMTPSECIEYAFGEQPARYRLAQITRSALETYRGQKFKAWQNMLDSPTCEAQFRRMLQIGVITRLFDTHVFPTPEDLKSLYQVTDEKSGKVITLPHPVSELRVWDPAKQQYESISSHLDGAPADQEKSSWWEKKLQGLKEQHGEEYMATLMKA
eukprot:gnl/TRDRNA2_/TRDRNA2_192001_c0_seq1.p1 gnl/TRDRNA2_/TRDRNA2_192001_c0~~gnl/TRDRNA2_/TRDRNA2_192001_c0_seq1.p1  ORF type:complete len:243 (+),score=37.57 gnl/TRDRNA2_/TRDRNA2_192001_c0_seq1:131-859(+)